LHNARLRKKGENRVKNAEKINIVAEIKAEKRGVKILEGGAGYDFTVLSFAKRGKIIFKLPRKGRKLNHGNSYFTSTTVTGTLISIYFRLLSKEFAKREKEPCNLSA
jgi:hypothetical protein